MVYKKNENYNKEHLKKIINTYRIAKKNGMTDLQERQAELIYDYIKRYVEKYLWEHYSTLMHNPQHKDDIIQDVWVKIFEKLDTYDPDKGSLTTFAKPWIKHVVSNYYSNTMCQTTTYYGNALSKVRGAVNMCTQRGIVPTEALIEQITNLPDSTIAHCLRLLENNKVSYNDALEEDVVEYIPSPEETSIRNDFTEKFNEFLSQNLTEQELEVIKHLVNPLDSRKDRASYREIAAETHMNMPQVKDLVSSVAQKMKNSSILKTYYPELYKSVHPSIEFEDADDPFDMFETGTFIIRNTHL